MLVFSRFCILTIVLFFTLTLGGNPASANVQFHAQFEASQACEAFQSLRQETNPGNVRLTIKKIYRVVGKNKPEATFYYLKIDDANPSLRWVAVECGKIINSAISPSPSQANPDNLLAISWQPSFCETRPNTPECQNQTETRFDATNFTLHGLWPQPKSNIFCNVSDRVKSLDARGQWLDLPPLELSEATVNELRIKMPGVTSGLHLHEWYKHGTCYSDTPEEYFQESIQLLLNFPHTKILFTTRKPI